MAHRRLAAIGLPVGVGPVGVGDEADGRVERETGRDGVEPPRVQGKQVLQPHHGVEQSEAASGEAQHAERIGDPSLLHRRVHPREPIESALDGTQDWRQEGAPSLEEVGDEASEWVGGVDHESQDQGDIQPADDRHDLSSYAGLGRVLSNSYRDTAIHAWRGSGAGGVFVRRQSRKPKQFNFRRFVRPSSLPRNAFDGLPAWPSLALRSSSSIRWGRG